MSILIDLLLESLYPVFEKRGIHTRVHEGFYHSVVALAFVDGKRGTKASGLKMPVHPV
ncbi:hypothetical protein ig2599ANME_1331 [groundwater metagenome]